MTMSTWSNICTNSDISARCSQLTVAMAACFLLSYTSTRRCGHKFSACIFHWPTSVVGTTIKVAGVRTAPQYAGLSTDGLSPGGCSPERAGCAQINANTCTGIRKVKDTVLLPRRFFPTPSLHTEILREMFVDTEPPCQTHCENVEPHKKYATRATYME